MGTKGAQGHAAVYQPLGYLMQSHIKACTVWQLAQMSTGWALPAMALGAQALTSPTFFSARAKTEMPAEIGSLKKADVSSTQGGPVLSPLKGDSDFHSADRAPSRMMACSCAEQMGYDCAPARELASWGNSSTIS